MKFKHTFHVFVDNFTLIYKLLLYRIIVFAIFGTIGYISVYTVMAELINSDALASLVEGVGNFISNFINGEVDGLSAIADEVKTAYGHLMTLLQTEFWRIIVSGLMLIFFLIVERWFAGLGNYSAALLINDKMALRASSPFVGSMISNLKEATIYNLIYVPLSVVYDIILSILVLIFVYFLVAQHIMPLLVGIFVFALIVIVGMAFKMTFTCDWLPALIRGKMGQKKSIKYTFSRKNKNTLNIFSNFVILLLTIMSVNVLVGFSTIGVGLLITIPSSYAVILCFEMVNYYDREELKYFLDKNTIIKPGREQTVSREQFFKGDNDD